MDVTRADLDDGDGERTWATAPGSVSDIEFV
jgi:hypothetical protein